MAHIVVGVDGSDHSLSALRWAARESDLRGEPLLAFLAWSYLDQRHVGGVDRFDADYSEGDADAALEDAVVRALGPERAATVVRRTVLDLPARALLEVSGEASSLVLGARGLGGFRGLLLGSVSVQVLMHAPCPVAIVRTEPDPAGAPGTERVVVGIDGSPSSRAALRWGIHAATLRRAVLEVVQAWNLSMYDRLALGPLGLDRATYETAARQSIDASLEGEDTSGVGRVERVVVEGHAAEVIVEHARGASVVVVGTRGRGGFAGLHLGSVSFQVAQHAPCPAVVVPSEP